MQETFIKEQEASELLRGTYFIKHISSNLFY